MSNLAMTQHKSVYVGTYVHDNAYLDRGEGEPRVSVKNLINPDLDGKHIRVTVELLPEKGVVDKALAENAVAAKFREAPEPTDED